MMRGYADPPQRRADLAGHVLDGVVFQQAGLAIDTVVMGVEPMARHIRGRPVAQMPARRKVHAENAAPRRRQREEHGLIRLRPGVRLDVDVLRPEQLSGTLDRQILDDVDILPAAVKPLSRIALERLVVDLVAKGLAHGAADDVLRRDELDLRRLAFAFLLERGGDLRVGFGQRGVVQGAAMRRPCSLCRPRMTCRRGGCAAVDGRRCGHRMACLERADEAVDDAGQPGRPCLAGVPGFEPGYAGVKVPCLY